jgi:hypothetical protein
LTLLATLTRSTIQSPAEDETLTLEAIRVPDVWITDVNVCVNAPGFQIVGGSSCVPVEVFNKGANGTLHPTEVKLKPSLSTGLYKVLLTATWVRSVPKNSVKKGSVTQVDCGKNPPGCQQLSEEVLLPVGPVQLDLNRWQRFTQRCVKLAKDFALPVLVLLVGYLFSRATSKREEANQIAQILLPKVMRMAGHYYLPMTWHAGKTVAGLKATPPNTNELTFYMLSFHLVSRKLKEAEGGVFFKNLTAEEIFAVGIQILRADLVLAAGGEKALAKALDDLEAWTTAKRWPRLAEQPAAKTATWLMLESWIGGVTGDPLLVLLYLYDRLASVLRYESNAPYENWYTDTQPFSVTESVVEPAPSKFTGFVKEAQELMRNLAIYQNGKNG